MYQAQEDRYQKMKYHRCGKSGLKLPAISLGLWQNFGEKDPLEKSRAMVLGAFDLGITHFDLANNYGPPPGAAESTFGAIMASDLKPYRDQLVISTKAGYDMWPGPYGEWGSRKYLISSLDQSLKRLGLDYVDIFYSHRPDPDTPLEETLGALDQVVRQGKALYVGISNYNLEDSRKAVKILKDLGTPCLIHQPSYSMVNRWVEEGLLDYLNGEGVGVIAYSPLAQGLLTDKYLDSVPTDSRAGKDSPWFKAKDITQEKRDRLWALNMIAQERGQTLASMALAWVLRRNRVTSVILGASRVSQIEEGIKTLDHLDFSDDELEKIDTIIKHFN